MNGCSKILLLNHLLCFFAVTVWGSTFAVTKQLLEVLTPMQILLLRTLIGYGVLWTLAPHRLPFRSWREEGRLALAGFLGITLYFILENAALLYGRAGMVSVLVCTAPLLTALLPRLAGRGTRLGRNYWIGFLLSATGVILTISHGDLTLLQGSRLSALFAILGALCWACYTLLPQTVPEPALKLPVTRRIFFWAILLMLPVCALEWRDWRFTPLLRGEILLQLGFLGAVAGALCYAAWNASVRVIGSTRASLWLYLNPVVGVIAAALLLNEALNLFSGLGCLLTLTGIACALHLSPRKDQPA